MIQFKSYPVVPAPQSINWLGFLELQSKKLHAERQIQTLKQQVSKAVKGV